MEWLVNKSGELVPIISRNDFDLEATKFLKKYYPLSLQEPVAVPIRKIAEQELQLNIIEDISLSAEMNIFRYGKSHYCL